MNGKGTILTLFGWATVALLTAAPALDARADVLLQNGYWDARPPPQLKHHGGSI